MEKSTESQPKPYGGDSIKPHGFFEAPHGHCSETGSATWIAYTTSSGKLWQPFLLVLMCFNVVRRRNHRPFFPSTAGSFCFPRVSYRRGVSGLLFAGRQGEFIVCGGQVRARGHHMW